MFSRFPLRFHSFERRAFNCFVGVKFSFVGVSTLAGISPGTYCLTLGLDHPLVA